jgi:hypothetical protein
MKKSHFKYIGIDPGVSGGIAVINEKNEIQAYKCPRSSDDMALLFQMCIGSTPTDKIRLVMERVWARPTNAVRAAFSYGVNYGQWLGVTASHEVVMNTVLPLEWMRWVGCPKALKKIIRKRWLKEKASELYPSIKRVTLATADAILITHYSKTSSEEYFNE